MILLLSVSAEQEKTETVRYFCLYGYNVRMRITSIKQECAGCCILAQANGDILHMHINIILSNISIAWRFNCSFDNINYSFCPPIIIS